MPNIVRSAFIWLVVLVSSALQAAPPAATGDRKVTFISTSARPYNVILYLYGHSGTGIKPWAPEGESKKWLCINDGQTENGFFVISIGKDQMRYGYHCRVFSSEPGLNGKPKKVDTGQWEWRYTGTAKLGQ